MEIALNSSGLGGRQLTPAEKHAAQDECSQITKQMRRRQRRADAIQAAGRGCVGEVLPVIWAGGFGIILRGEGRSRRRQVRLGGVSEVYFRYTAKSEGYANSSSDMLR
ncbi:MAG: hypothetical protein ACXQS5_07445 [Candidatus Methanospirareceae archaeon]